MSTSTLTSKGQTTTPKDIRNDSEEPGYSDLLTVLVSGGQGEEAGVDGLHAEAAHDSHRYAEEWDTVAGGSESAGLIFKTVPDPDYRLRVP